MSTSFAMKFLSIEIDVDKILLFKLIHSWKLLILIYGGELKWGSFHTVLVCSRFEILLFLVKKLE